MKKQHILFAFILIFIFTQNALSAGYGACSSHSGVNCASGATMTGKVTCNDGWVNSSVYYSDVMECKDENACPRYLSQSEYASEKSFIQSYIDQVKQKIEQNKESRKSVCATASAASQNRANQAYDNCDRYSRGMEILSINNGSAQYGMAPALPNCKAQYDSSINAAKREYDACLLRGTDSGEKMLLDLYRQQSCLRVVSTSKTYTQEEAKKIVDSAVKDIKQKTPNTTPKTIVSTKESTNTAVTAESPAKENYYPRTNFDMVRDKVVAFFNRMFKKK